MACSERVMISLSRKISRGKKEFFPQLAFYLNIPVIMARFLSSIMPILTSIGS